MSLFLRLMLVQKMIVAALPLSLSHVCFKIGNEGTGIHTPQFKYCCFVRSGRAALQSRQWLKGLFSAVPLSKPGAKISLILLSPNTRSTAFAYRRASDLSPVNLGADYNQLLKNREDQANICYPPVLLPRGHSQLVVCPFQPSVERHAASASVLADPDALF